MKKGILLITIIAGLVFAQEFNPYHELGLGFGNFQYNIQYPDKQEMNIARSVYYNYHFTPNMAIGVESGPMNFRFLSEKKEPIYDNRLYREQIGVDADFYSIYIKQNTGKLLSLGKNTYLKAGYTNLSPKATELLTNEHQALLNTYYESQVTTYPEGMKNFSATPRLVSGGGLLFGINSDLYKENDFSINLDLVFNILELEYQYDIYGEVYNGSTGLTEQINRKETSVLRQSLGTVKLQCSYSFQVSKIIGGLKDDNTVKPIKKPENKPEPLKEVTDKKTITTTEDNELTSLEALLSLDKAVTTTSEKVKTIEPTKAPETPSGIQSKPVNTLPVAVAQKLPENNTPPKITNVEFGKSIIPIGDMTNVLVRVASPGDVAEVYMSLDGGQKTHLSTYGPAFRGPIYIESGSTAGRKNLTITVINNNGQKDKVERNVFVQ